MSFSFNFIIIISKTLSFIDLNNKRQYTTTMVDYSKSIIYTIRSKGNLYVGSTVNFRSRKSQHKNAIYNKNSKSYNFKLYKIIRENDGLWNMQPYSRFPCNSKLEQGIEEERVRQLLKADMNTWSCGSGLNYSELGKEAYLKQYTIENKDKLLEQKKQYREQNKDKIHEQDKQYREKNRDKINEKQKQNREKNKDKIHEQEKQYRDKNKDKISEYNKQKVTCDCGCIVTKRGLLRHKKSKKHINFMLKTQHP